LGTFIKLPTFNSATAQATETLGNILKRQNMFNKIFGSTTKETKTVHCEETGKPSSLSDTVVLTKINGVIAFNNLNNPQIDTDEKLIYSSGKPPIKYYSEIIVPDDLKGIMGRLFSIIDDEDELEQTTCVISPDGRRLHTEEQLIPFIDYVKQYEVVRLPDTMFVALVDNSTKTKMQTCDNWGMEYCSVGRKYRFKKILQEKREQQTFGTPGILWPGFDVAVGDCSQKNVHGTGYLFKTDNNFQNVNLACNESAVDYCIKNKCLVYYNDFLNNGKLRILSAYTEDINRKLQNPYLFRSSNI
jgi:hypothetical protein